MKHTWSRTCDWEHKENQKIYNALVGVGTRSLKNPNIGIGVRIFLRELESRAVVGKIKRPLPEWESNKNPDSASLLMQKSARHQNITSPSPYTPRTFTGHLHSFGPVWTSCSMYYRGRKFGPIVLKACSLKINCKSILTFF